MKAVEVSLNVPALTRNDLVRATLVLLLPVIMVMLRPALPADETRYLAVAWEMWQRKEFLLPYLNGLPYSDKPPLLFWLMHAGWAVAGVNETWPRLLPAFFFALTLPFVRRLGEQLWPRSTAGELAAWLLPGCTVLYLFSQQLMFDLPLLFFIVSALERYLVSLESGRRLPLVACGLLLGLAGLMKGPVVLMYVIPAFMLFEWNQRRSPRGAARRIGLVLAIGVFISGCWLFALAIHGQFEFLVDAVFMQSADRVAGAAGHPRPVWWYLPWLPVILLPWFLWPFAMRTLLAGLRSDRMSMASLVLAAGILFVFSMIGGKQMHYLFPLLVFTCLAVGRTLSLAGSTYAASIRFVAVQPLLLGMVLLALHFAWAPLDFSVEISLPMSLLVMAPALPALLSPRLVPDRGVPFSAALSMLSAASFLLAIAPLAERISDVRPAARLAAMMNARGADVAWVGAYHAELTFYARLREPLAVVPETNARSWLLHHENGVLFARERHARSLQGCSVVMKQVYRGGYLYALQSCH